MGVQLGLCAMPCAGEVTWVWEDVLQGAFCLVLLGLTGSVCAGMESHAGGLLQEVEELLLACSPAGGGSTKVEEEAGVPR